ncbi:MAG: polysaccharide biosynthesis/export family protein [Deferrisomatales bacterium]|nr:polysaccharide biosynthesis/export family protein [Deferrisomatales bacterium]
MLALALGTPGAGANDSLHDSYLLGSGDRVRVSVFGEPDLSGEFEVDGTGMVALPLIGELGAAGGSVRQLEQALRDALADGYLVDPRVSVEVLNYRPFYILGEVKSPGKYPYVSGMSVLNAVAMAGGYTHRAREGRAEITRGGDPGNVVKNAPPATPVYPGDIIRIPERFF